MFGITADEALLSARNKAAGFVADSSRRAFAAAVLGWLSIPLSGLAFINATWSKLPAPALGFVAILTGLIASQEIERSGGRKTGRRLAFTGIVTGIVGSFLGPVVIASFGRPRDRR
jgi:FtsH-binding integral membrane protein